MKCQLPFSPTCSTGLAGPAGPAGLAGSGKSQQLGYIKPQMADVDLSSALLFATGLVCLACTFPSSSCSSSIKIATLLETRARIREIPPRPAIGSTERYAACVKLAPGRKVPRRTMISKSQGSLHALCFLSVSSLFVVDVVVYTRYDLFMVHGPQTTN